MTWADEVSGKGNVGSRPAARGVERGPVPPGRSLGGGAELTGGSTASSRSGSVVRRVWWALIARVVEGSVVTVGCGESQQPGVMVSTAHTMDIGLVVLPNDGTVTGGSQSNRHLNDQ